MLHRQNYLQYSALSLQGTRRCLECRSELDGLDHCQPAFSRSELGRHRGSLHQIHLTVTRCSKAFFSEEKKQKTFISLSRMSPEAYVTRAKVFWFFFPKKNCLPSAHRFHSHGNGMTKEAASVPGCALNGETLAGQTRTTILPPALFSSMHWCAFAISSIRNVRPTCTRSSPRAICAASSSMGVSPKVSASVR
jgi:hypothetical protein